MTVELTPGGKVAVNYIKKEDKTIQRSCKGMCKGPEVGRKGRKASCERVQKAKQHTMGEAGGASLLRVFMPF